MDLSSKAKERSLNIPYISVTSRNFELLDGFCWHQKWGEPSPQTQGHLQTLGSQYLQHICYFSFEVFLGNGMEGTLPEEILLTIRRGSKIFTVKDYQTANIRQSTGTGIIYKIPVVSTWVIIRFLQQWVIAYNGYDGNIYIMTAKTLPNFDTPRILIPKEDGKPDQKQWYPNIIHKFMGIKLELLYLIILYLILFRGPIGWQYPPHVLERLPKWTRTSEHFQKNQIRDLREQLQ